MLQRSFLSACAGLFCLVSVCQAEIITQWDFNGLSNSTNPAALIGSGTASLVGGVVGSFSSGSGDGGSSDPVTAPNDSAWQTVTYATQGQQNKLRGVQFSVSTVGYQNISLNYDIRKSNTASRYEQVQYSLNGTDFTDISLFDGNAASSWFNGRSVDLASIAGVADNPNFAFRIVAAFAPGTSEYQAANSTSTYATGGTWRFDMVTLNGTAAAVPEAGSLAGLSLVAVGMAAAGIRRRRQA